MVDPLSSIKMASYISQLPSLFFFLSATIQAVANLKVSTPPRVTVPLGGNVTIPCTADSSELDAIYWNRVADYGSLEIVVSRVFPEDPTGVGLDSGDFNITANNSLVINYMRLEYEQPYVCIVLDTSLADDSSTTEVIATVKPREAPTIKFSCHGGPCGPQLEEEDFVNLTCTSDEARPPVTLMWTNPAGTIIQELFNDTQDGSQLGTFVTSSTIQYKFKRATTLTCHADGEAVGKDSAEQQAMVELSLKTTEAPTQGTGSPSGTKPPNARQDNYNGEGENGRGGLDLVTILMVAVAVSVLVVIILIVAVVVLYKKNQESPSSQSCMMKYFIV